MELLSEIKGLNLLCEYLIKSSLVLAFALLLVFISRKKPASLRHFVLSLSLASLLLIPFLSSLTPGWETKLIPAWQAGWKGLSTSQDWVKSKEVPVQKNHEDTSIHAKNMQPQGLVEASHADTRSLQSILAAKKNSLGVSFIVLWSLGIIFLLTRILLGLYGAYRLTRQGEKIFYSSWQQLLQKLLKTIPLKRKISLLSHKQVMAPLTWGVRKPVVIFPVESRKWTTCQRSSALFHELSHIKRGDFLIKMIARISCALFWFNPLSWITLKMMKEEQEKACDELVLKAGVRPSTYAANLLSIKKSRHAHWSPPAATLGAVGKSQFNDRLMAILKKQFNPKEIRMKTKIILALTVILVICIIGLARPSQTEAFPKKHFMFQELLPGETSQTSPAKDTQEKKEKKQTEKESKDAQEKKKDTKLVVKEGESEVHEVHIIKGDKIKKLDLKGKTITIVCKDGSKKTFSLSMDKGDLIIAGEKEGHWTIKTDKLGFIKGDKVKTITIDDGSTIWIKTKDKKEPVKVLELVSPKLHILTRKKAHKAYTIHFDKEKGEGQKVRISPYIQVHPVIHLESKQGKLKEKIKKIQEKLKIVKEQEESQTTAEIKEQAFKEVEEMLKELAEELEIKSEKLKDISLSIHPATKIKIKDHLEDKKKITASHAIIDLHHEDKFIGFIDEDKGIKIIFKSELDDEQKIKHEELLQRLKEKLPESYKIESITDEESNTFIIKITSDSKDKDHKKNLHKLLKEIIEEFKKTKDNGHNLAS